MKICACSSELATAWPLPDCSRSSSATRMPSAQKSPAGQVGDRDADAHRAAAGLARDGHQPAHALRDLVEARTLAVGPVLAEARDAGVDEARVDLAQRRVVDAEPRPSRRGGSSRSPHRLSTRAGGARRHRPADFRSSVMPRLLRCRFWKSGPCRGPPSASPASECSGSSTLMTLAPQSANCRAAVGPARTRVRSRTVYRASAVEARELGMRASSGYGRVMQLATNPQRPKARLPHVSPMDNGPRSADIRQIVLVGQMAVPDPPFDRPAVEIVHHAVQHHHRRSRRDTEIACHPGVAWPIEMRSSALPSRTGVLLGQPDDAIRRVLLHQVGKQGSRQRHVLDMKVVAVDGRTPVDAIDGSSGRSRKRRHSASLALPSVDLDVPTRPHDALPSGLRRLLKRMASSSDDLVVHERAPALPPREQALRLHQVEGLAHGAGS